MGRKSILTPKQWDEIVRRNMTDGVSIRKLSREFGISESGIRDYLRSQKQKIKNVAIQMVNVNEALHSLSPRAQLTAQNVAGKILAMKSNCLDAGMAMSEVSKHIAQATTRQVAKQKDSDLLTKTMLNDVLLASNVVNSALKPAFEFMTIQASEKTVEEQPKITVIGGMNLTPMVYEHPPRNISEQNK